MKLPKNSCRTSGRDHPDRWVVHMMPHIYQHFQDCEKVHEIDPHVPTEHIEDTIYPQINNNIEYGLFENVIDSYYLNSQMG